MRRPSLSSDAGSFPNNSADDALMPVTRTANGVTERIDDGMIRLPGTGSVLPGARLMFQGLYRQVSLSDRRSRFVGGCSHLIHLEVEGRIMGRTSYLRRHARRILFVALFVGLPWATTAFAQSLPGWGPYRFGTFRSKIVTDEGRVLLPGKGIGGADLLDSARIDGQLYTVGLWFRGAVPDAKLWKIQLLPELGKMDQAGCNRFFEKIAGKLKDKYGEMQGDAARSLVVGRVAAQRKQFEDGSTLTASVIASDRCNVDVTYQAPPVRPIDASGF